jgi:hypothetical protein
LISVGEGEQDRDAAGQCCPGPQWCEPPPGCENPNCSKRD